ncbi:hypothetical protein FHS43_000417 [Streptosporangium becharense]|uniref:Uncharacterized protein n=1 Tax=Streptosporangium becharense TaxID=1816182 RepID=A0A7W9IFK2_9ACTN|nr:hypothetical protein [Streptosporangium becharense]MBB2909171.1 hypothetical protein [Streptosporangium becharense]MBB5819810.1 hypothetical protein [Streptosporangium becharense]
MLQNPRVATIRALDESDRPHMYWHGMDVDGHVWLFETVIDDGGEYWPVRHAELGPDGISRRYSWDHIEDEHGFLAEGPLYPDDFGLNALTAEEFGTLWAALNR